jgi:hypothetical protein
LKDSPVCHTTWPPRVIWTTVLEAGGTVEPGTADGGAVGTDVDVDGGAVADEDFDGWLDGAGREATEDPHPAVSTRRNTADSTSRLFPTVRSLTGFANPPTSVPNHRLGGGQRSWPTGTSGMVE